MKRMDLAVAVLKTTGFASTAAKERDGGGEGGGSGSGGVRGRRVAGGNAGRQRKPILAFSKILLLAVYLNIDSIVFLILLQKHSSGGDEFVTNAIADRWNYDLHYIRAFAMKLSGKQDAKANGPSPADGKASIRLANRQMDHQYFPQYTAS
uniref:Uncharacterized protein n=1 Tax=Oryza nivara TaxID=4536 RepID=A0A0E0GPS6_ORYNI